VTQPIKNAKSESSMPRIFEAIQKTLVSHKARHITFSYEGERIIAIEFVIAINGSERPFKLPARIENVEKILYPGKPSRFLTTVQKTQAYRTAWANVRDWISAQMAMIDTGMVQPEEIFLPYMVDNQGRTFYEVMQEKQFLLPSGERSMQDS